VQHHVAPRFEDFRNLDKLINHCFERPSSVEVISRKEGRNGHANKHNKAITLDERGGVVHCVIE
jgi:hypothetical protein